MILGVVTDAELGQCPTLRSPAYRRWRNSDHRAIKRRVRASQHFRSFWGAWRTIAGYEAIHMIRKGRACWSAVGAEVGLLHRFILVCSRR